MDDLRGCFERAFVEIDGKAREILSSVRPADLFKNLSDPIIDHFTVGECIIRSAAVVEQAFNGITRRLWDDPFEWTLPESLPDKPAIEEYLNEVAAARADGFRYLTSDADLLRSIPAPVGMRSLQEILLDCLLRSSTTLGRASTGLDIINSKH